jgi:hypothetical protein
MSEAISAAPRFYFALPRLLAKWRGGDPIRAERNGTEAWLGGIATYAISYLFFLQFIPHALNPWVQAVVLVALSFVVLLVWLVLLYVNSLLIKVARLGGIFRSIPDRRGQSILIGATVTAMAWALVQRGGSMSEIGAIWIVAVTMNLIAAALLALNHESRGSA